MNKVLIVVPTYCCARQIRRVLSSLASLRSQLPEVQKVLVLDNCSSDATVSEAQEQIAEDQTSDWVEVRVNAKNKGLGGSQKTAFEEAQKGYTHLVVLHGDDQADPRDLIPLLAALGQNYDAVLGSRFMKGSHRMGYSLLRTYGNRGLNWLYGLLARRPVFDLGSGLNGFRSEALATLPFERFADQFTFNMDLLLSLIERQKSILFIPIHWREYDQVSNARTFAVGWMALRTVFAWRFGRKMKVES